MSDLETQIKVRADTTDVESGMSRAKRSIENLGGTTRRVAGEMTATTGKAARDLAAMGDGADVSAKKVERNTRQMQRDLERYLAQLQAGSRDSRAYWDKLASYRGVDTNALKPLLDQLGQVKKASGDASASLLSLARGGVSVFLGNEIVQAAAAAAKAIYSASAAGERLRTTLQFATGNSGRDMLYLTELTTRLGLRMEGTAQAYASFAAAARGTSIEGQKTKDIFEAVSKAASVMGLSTEQSSGALLALQQMISKGTVQAEELRGQLGERLPGSFQVAAKAMGVTTAELGKMLEQGQIVADDFLPKFARALNEHVGDAAENAANRLDAAVNRLDSAWERLKRNVGDSGASKGMQDGMNALQDRVVAVSEAMELARAKGGGFFMQMAAGGAVVVQLTTPIGLLTGEVHSLGKQLDDAEKRLVALKEQGAANSPNIYLRSAYADAQALVNKLKEARGEIAGLGGAGAGRGSVNPETTVQQAARFTNVDSYLNNSARQTKGEQQAAENTKAKIAYEKAYKDAIGDTNRQLQVKAAYETELGAIAEKYKDKGGAAAAKKEQSAYESLVASIKTKIATNKEELEFGSRLTDSDKLRIKLLAELDAGSKTLTATHRASALALLETLDAQERQKAATAASIKVFQEQVALSEEAAQAYVQESKAREQGALAVSTYLKGITDTSEALQVEIDGIGKTAAERQKLIDKYNVELKLKQQIAAINANPGLTSDAARQSEIGRATTGAASDLINKDLAAAAKDLHAYLDPERAESFGSALRGAFESAMKPLSGVVDAMQDYTKELEANAKARAAIEKLFKNDPDKKASELRKVESKELRAQVGMWGDLTGAASGFFKDGSKGYKAMQGASQAFRAAEMVLALESMTRQLFSIGAVTTATVSGEATKAAAIQAGVGVQLAADATKGASAAAVGVATQAAGDPYSAFFRMAAMAAAMAALGFAVSGGSGGGGGGGGGGYTGIASGGTGTVLGMEGQQSESLSNAIDILADNSKIELAYTQKMLSELTKVREGIQGLAGTASTDFFIRGFAGASFGDDFLDSGIGFFPGQKVADIIEKGVQGVGFNLIFSNGAQAMWKALDEEFTTGVGKVLANVAETVFTAADALGLNDAALAERMLSLMPTLGDTSTYEMNGITAQGGGLVSLKDMSGEEIQKELEAIFSAVGDQMAAAALPALRPFQQIGEGMFETLIRVTTGIETAQYALEQFGLKAIDYADIVRKNGDIAVEIMRQTIMGVEQELATYRYGSAGMVVSGATPQTGLASIIDTFVGDASELQELYAGLLDVRGAMKSVGAQALDLSRDMIRGAGGLEALQSGLDAYLTNFFSEQEQVDAAWERMAEQFDRLGVAMPDTNEQFRAMVEGLDTSTAAGANLFGGMMSLADAFADVTGRTADLADAARAAAEEAAQAQAEAAEEAARRTADSWTALWRAVDGVAADFLTGDALRGYRAESLAQQFEGIGFTVSPEQLLGASQADFLALFHSIDMTTDAGREQASSLVGLWGAFKQLLPVTEDVTKALQDQANAMRQQAESAYQALQQSIAAEKTRLKAAYDAQVQALTAANQAAQEAARERVSSITTIFSAIDSAIDSTRINSEALGMEARRAAQARLQGGVDWARSGRSLTGYSDMTGALDILSQPSEDLFASFEDYARDQAASAVLMIELRDRAKAQVSVAEMTLKAITDSGAAQLKALQAQYDAEILALDETLEYWRQQLDAVKGLNSSVLSVREAVYAMSNAVASALSANAAAGKAVDGSHASGLAYVPFDGYRAELHRGETVLNAEQAKLYRGGALGGSSSSGGGLTREDVRELSALLRANVEVNDSTRMATEQMAGIFRRADGGNGLVTMTPEDAEA